MSGNTGAPLALTMGDPAGIGPDLILTLYANRQIHDLPVFAVYGHLDFLKARAERLGLNMAIAPLEVASAHGMFPDVLPVIPIAGDVRDIPDRPRPEAAPAVIAAIEHAVADTLSGATRGIVTAPINKAALYDSGFAHPGHTEFLASLCARTDRVCHPVMMLVHENFRVVPLTIHIPLADVPGAITSELIRTTVETVHGDLQGRFGVTSPRIGVTGLNPHAGENGTIGREEVEIIAPALDSLRRQGFDVVGPLPADTVFHPPHWRHYDAVIAMYHDQALIPIKTLAFDAGVNVTLGLPIVRTSPDHGTAYSLAGTGKASPASMLAAIRLADRLA